MKLTKYIIGIFLILILLVSPVYAGLEVFSSSSIDFESNDPDIRGEAFLVSVVENGGSEKILFGDFKPDTGYEIEPSTGYISAKASNIFVDYPYFTRNTDSEIYKIVKLNGGFSKWFISWNSAQSWCNDLAGLKSSYAGTEGLQYMGNYYCYTTDHVGSIADFSSDHQYNWRETFSIYNPLDDSLQTVILDAQKSTDIATYSRESGDGNVIIKYIFSGVSGSSTVPSDFPARLSVAQYNSNSAVINRIDPTEADDFGRAEVLDRFLLEHLGGTLYFNLIRNDDWAYGLTHSAINSPEVIREKIDDEILSLLKPVTISENGWSASTPQEISSERGVLRLTKTDTNYPVSPVFSIKLDAEWMGVYQPVGNPVIDSFEVKGTDEFVEGDLGMRIYSKVTNDASVSATFDYILACSPDNVGTINAISNVGFTAGQTREIIHQVTSSTTGENKDLECCLIVRDRSNPRIISSQECETITIIEKNRCGLGVEAGDTTCSADGTILNCVENTDGLLILQPSAFDCDFGCSLDDNHAVCDQKPGCQDNYVKGEGCEDGICQLFERGGDCACLEDCSIPGDGYCSKTERELQSAPTDCEGKPEFPEYIFWILFGVLSFGLIGGAIFLKARKEGVI